jgi:hypothetical protein
MKILWVTTKAPWPPADGGRLLVANTLAALSAAGHEVTLVTPVDPDRADPGLAAALRAFCVPHLVASRPRSLALAVLRSRLQGVPVTVARHARDVVRRQVGRLLATHAFDVVHAEQVQALPQCEDAPRWSLPVVLRSQNVETDLWAAAARGSPLLGGLVRGEEGRLAAWEGRAVRRAAATVALTARDAARLRALSGAGVRVHEIRAPFPATLPPAREPLPGKPAVVVLGSDGWRPNREGAAWFLARVWPAVKAVLPSAILHLFGSGTHRGSGAGVIVRPPPEDSRVAFPAGAVFVVPVPFASGVRMRILEAWARGIPVVATPAAAEGLDADDGRELLIAPDPAGFATAIRRLHDRLEVAAALVAAGRSFLATHHDPRRVTAQLLDVYTAVRA